MNIARAHYRGRLAPTPSGRLHLGHAATFMAAARRARERSGRLVLRVDDIDLARCQPRFVTAAIEDLRWLGIDWHEGPERGGPHPPYFQSQRLASYRAAFSRLRAAGLVYPCSCSRRDIDNAARAPHAADDGETIYPGTCRGRDPDSVADDAPVAWRFRVPDGRRIVFGDIAAGRQEFVCGRDFGDFPVWRRDRLPSYHLASVSDDIAMAISEVVRGADLLLSTARQILLFRALGAQPPAFLHCPLVTDEHGRRLAKRDQSLALDSLRRRGLKPSELIAGLGAGAPFTPR